MFPDQPAPMPAPPSSSPSKLLVVLVALFGFGTLVFGILAVVEFSQAFQAKVTLSAATQAAKKDGASGQKLADDERYQQENETPFRSYVSPDILGHFEIKFPKNWNGYVVQNTDGSPQINLTLHPEFVKQISGQDNVYALHFQLIRQTYDTMVKSKENDVKGGKLKQSTVTVSGITGSRYEGKYDSKHDGVTVIVPVRDKVMLFATDDKKYLPEFNQVLSQATITP